MVSDMRRRAEIEGDTESIHRNYDGSIQYGKADSEDMQVLILEVLLDIRKLLSGGVNE